jgi:hypothetical protein
MARRLYVDCLAKKNEFHFSRNESRFAESKMALAQCGRRSNMTRAGWSILALAACAGAGCQEGHGAGDPVPMMPPSSIVLEIDGKTFQAGCANGQSGTGFASGASCGTGGPGWGPIFQSLECDQPLRQTVPSYTLGTMFRNFDRSGVADGTTFDLSDPTHEQFVTVMMNYMDASLTEHDFCTAAPAGSDPTAYPASSGIVTIHQLAPDPGAPPGVFTSEVEVTNAVVPSVKGGAAMQILAAHLYFQ